MRPRGIEPLAKPWKGFMLPLHHERLNSFFSYYLNIYRQTIALYPNELHFQETLYIKYRTILVTHYIHTHPVVQFVQKSEIR